MSIKGTNLRYVGPAPAVVGMVPLPEGWPAEDHTELDDEIAKAKLASGKYERAKAAAATDAPAEE